ncbi:MAG TPA: lysophospholipid acyltransferase family protein [Candidatus Acidoferrum sp.]|nr:lysophospholipid acyltransferase family protein [Candidatus Acidoferrum sp.]
MFYRLMQLLTRPINLFFRVKITYEGPVPMEGPLVVCGKHISQLEPILLFSNFPRKMKTLAKIELFKNPIKSWVLMALGAIPINRGKNDISAIKKALKTLKHGEVLGIFPEGQRLKNNDLDDVKNGAMGMAIRTGATVLPFGVYTQDYTLRPFRRVELRFGKAVPVATFGATPGRHQEYSRVTEWLAGELRRLSDKDYVFEGDVSCPTR